MELLAFIGMLYLLSILGGCGRDYRGSGYQPKPLDDGKVEGLNPPNAGSSIVIPPKK